MTGLAWARDPRVTYFASGSNRPGEIRGLGRAGIGVGVSAAEVARAEPIRDVAADRYDPAREGVEAELVAAGVPLFVDSGAFSEVTFGPGGPEVVRPMERRDWLRVLELYGRLAAVLELHGRAGALFVVAPDRVGDQTVTLDRLDEYGWWISHARERGANILVPVQKGALSMAAFYGAAVEVLGEGRGRSAGDVIPAIPMKKDATSLRELRAFLLEVRPARIHLLGLGPTSRRFEATLRMIRELVPGCDVSCDSVALRSLVGRSNGRRGRARALTAAVDQVVAEHPDLDVHEARARAIVTIAARGEREIVQQLDLPLIEWAPRCGNTRGPDEPGKVARQGAP